MTSILLPVLENPDKQLELLQPWYIKKINQLLLSMLNITCFKVYLNKVEDNKLMQTVTVFSQVTLTHSLLK